MSRSLGAEIVGLYQISLSVLILLFTLTAGAPTVLSRKVAEAQSMGDVKRQNALTTASVIIGMSVATVICVIFYSLSRDLGFIFTDERCVELFLIMLPVLWTSTLYSSLRSWFWGRKNFLAFSSTELLDEILKILLSVLLAGGLISTLSGARGVAVAFTLADVLCVGLLAIFFVKAGGKFAKPAGFKEIIFATVPLSATRIISSLTASLTALVIPQMLVSGGMPVAEATAAYGRVAGMAFPLIMAPITLVSALSVVLTPDIAQMRAKGNLVSVRDKLGGSLTFAVLIAALFFTLYLPLGKELGVLFFKDAQAGDFVSYCSILLFPVAVSQVTTPVLNSLGCEKQTFVSSVLGAICILPCIFFLPRYIGVYSMAVGSGICFTLTGIINLVVLSKKLGGIGNLKRCASVFFFALPLGITGMFAGRLLRAASDSVFVTIAVVGTYVLFLLVLFINAFSIADISGYIKTALPPLAVLTSKFKPKTKDKRRRDNRSADGKTETTAESGVNMSKHRKPLRKRKAVLLYQSQD
jgi:stage V sporulation protein B